MFNDVSATFDKKKRPSFSRKHFDVPLLKALVYDSTTLPTACSENCIKQYIGSNAPYHDGGLKERKVYSVADQDFKSCLINDAIAQFNKAVYNWSIYKQLVSKGLWSWAFVTLYYSQFYSVNALLNLQGNAFSRPILRNVTGEESKTSFHVYTEDFREGKFIFEMRDLRSHEDVWQEYHHVYRSYRYELKEYNELYQFDRENNGKFLELRHLMNYDISFLFNGFLEYLLTSEELEEFALKMQQDVFEASIDRDTELELEYIASLRIRLLFDMLYEILDTAHLAALRRNIYSSQVEMLNKIKDDTPVKTSLLKWISLKKSRTS